MAANKFATMVHRNTNKIMLILTYTVLEWILILLLLLNSFFSYLILKFADYFGLPRPCLWCSRLDQLFDSSKATIHYGDLVCEHHAGEISNLGFCSNHRKLAAFQDLCGECSSSLPSNSGSSETPVTCSCCGLSVERKLTSLPPTGDLATEEGEGGFVVADGISSDVLGDHTEEEFGEFLVSDGGCGEGNELHPCPCPSAESGFIEMVTVTDEDEKLVMVMEVESQKEEENRIMLPVDDEYDSKKNEVEAGSAPHLEFFIGDDECELIPVEWVVNTKGRKQHKLSLTMEEDDGGSEDVIIDFCSSAKPRRSSRRKKVATLFSIQESDEEHYIEHIPEAAVEADIAEGGEQFDNPHIDKVNNVQKIAEGDAVKEGNDHIPTAQTVEIEYVLEEAVGGDSDKEVDKDADNIAQADEIDNVQEASETDSLKQGDEHFPTSHNIENVLEMVEPSPTEEGNKQAGIAETADVPEHGDVLQETAVHEAAEDISPAEEEYVRESDDINAEVSIGEEIPNHELIDDIHTQDVGSSNSGEVPSLGNDHEYIGNEDGLEVEVGNLEFKVILIEQSEQAANKNEEDSFPEAPTAIDSLHRTLEKRDSVMSEESLDRSVTSEIENSEGPITMEMLKSALKAERKALNGLYAELEEERNASAVAASQTMAMINRLQEEKATMQMEALQYQRMMEEQAEYDQEALQLLNDLMVKRETEKRELQKELEVYKKKVEEFEAREKIEMLFRCKDKDCEEDSEGFSGDYDEAKEEYPQNNNNNTPSDAILYLEDSLANFEEERNSILDQLKVLEEKLLHDEGKENGNGHYAMNGKHYKQGRFMGPKAKTLLPLFNATGEDEQEHDEDELQKTPPGIKMEDDKVDTEEEVNQLYERLQVLETDREFLKHCISSLKKGDKGLPILHEILQHLRDLRSIELHGQEIMDGVI